MTAYNGHSEDCICVPCMNADMEAHIRENFGEDVLMRINADPANRYRDTAVRTRYAKPGQRCGRGVVRLVSERQVRFIKSLLASRDTSKLIRLPGSEDIERMSLAGARDLIERLLACPERLVSKVPSVALATEKQVEWLAKLSGKNVPAEIEAIRLKGAEATKAEASKALDALFKAPSIKVEVAKPGELTGIWFLEGSYYRMQKARTGSHFYAKVLDRDAGDAWLYASGMARRVPAEGRKLSLEECEALSLQLGACCLCGKTLTATVDGVGPGARFIGPVCKGRMGF